MLCFEIDNELAHGDWQGAVHVMLLFSRWTEKNHYALLIKSVCMAAKRPFRQRGLSCSFSWSLTIQDNGANTFIQPLFWKASPLLNLFPIIGSLLSFAFRFRHPCPSLMGGPSCALLMKLQLVDNFINYFSLCSDGETRQIQILSFDTAHGITIGGIMGGRKHLFGIESRLYTSFKRAIKHPC